ncbi:Catechol-2,3-dioxygenase [Paenibacillus polymyxa E681]|uniref:VOC family protein n=1 Tax=Paenibacillus polymyxa TaxID=1406 RepID=UPI0001E31C94|nr:VOC family protein [Paenibacillus polymyxa]ADM70273.1 catechol 2,3 dioxygenase [Paenibacillus polymyxa E681]QNV57301.1 Catechol-2,3-dioxygenase [Paenibacillus polymyxa E681]QNV62138.1 Catechol-2,3-dioxygenase [Paenibacillus polymyxa E681]
MTAHIHDNTKIWQVSLKVSNLERSIQFYTEVVGFQLLRQTADTAELTVDGKHALLILNYIENAIILPRQSAAGLYHFAILLPNRVALGLSLRNLLAHEIEIGQGDHDVSEALYIHDPDNNGIEIYADRPRDQWKKDANGFYIMGTDPVDAEDLVAISENLPWQGLPQGTVIGHVHFHVSNLLKAQQFYCDVLGFDITCRYGSSALFVSAGGYHHHMGLNIWAGEGAPPAPEHAVGLDYFELIVPDQNELDAIVARLEAAGYGVQERDGAKYVADPFRIEIKLISGQIS